MKQVGWLIVLSLFLFTGCSKMNIEKDHHQVPDFTERHSVADTITVEFSGIDLMMEEMSVEEKIGQLLIVGMSGKTFNGEIDRLIRQNKVGGIILLGKNISTPSGIVQLLNDSKKANEGNDIQLLLSVDEEGGRVSRIPAGMKKLPAASLIGQKNKESFAYETGIYLAELLHSFGYNMNFAPVLDVNSNPQNPVIGDRSFSSDPYKVASLGMSVMKGMTDNGIISVVKHFPGHGDTHIDSHKALPIIQKSLQELKQTELVPFQKAIDENVDMIMVAHILFPELDKEYPSSLSKKIITDLLRNEMHYNGVVITDDLTMGAIVNEYTVAEAAIQSFLAGSDLLLIAGDYQNQVDTFDTLVAAVESGIISMERLDESVKRILELKNRYELDDKVIEEIDVKKLNQKYDELMS
ncbi:beta-N-acetylhexosaminidase [Sporosarcina thermotolerans]|uniref:Beta-N-acetylhexosaminidase n=1 Tax=Sporosarcina thermotolerans TaxID=633404 RepID=A0AAW9A6X9_9BACL|nr:beta-N-acetylhexosaminidase [Sporosarcina thermotolerans]MDW0117107.1 beta-N-acetylhexosaminidase [Sporosarcina thermotolerans]WHT47801.1 beta-N-acetylhexosaminidase [Sporosarcina thermotolerans]